MTTPLRAISGDQDVLVRCPECEGTGHGRSFTRPADLCRYCGGTGKVRPLPRPDEQEKTA